MEKYFKWIISKFYGCTFSAFVRGETFLQVFYQNLRIFLSRITQN